MHTRRPQAGTKGPTAGPLEWPRSEGEIQAFLDRTEYSADPFYRCPARVLRDRKAHCVDGALFAAAALRRLGHPPLILELTAVRDDDHYVAVFRKEGLLGAIGKSNFVGLRYREPIHRTPRELALSYFEAYYNTAGEKTLRGFSCLVDLSRFDAFEWMTRDERIEEMTLRIEKVRHYPIAPEQALARLLPMDRRSYDAGLVGVNAAGLFDPSRPKA
jgi:hypothetical protein